MRWGATPAQWGDFKWGDGGLSVVLVSPTGATINPNQPIVLDITDDTGIKRAFLYATFSTDIRTELIYQKWNGVTFEFGANYSGSTITPIPGGNQYRLVRTNGWPGNVDFVADVIDDDGNEN